jgi:hypothetical protein
MFAIKLILDRTPDLKPDDLLPRARGFEQEGFNQEEQDHCADDRVAADWRAAPRPIAGISPASSNYRGVPTAPSSIDLSIHSPITFSASSAHAGSTLTHQGRDRGGKQGGDIEHVGKTRSSNASYGSQRAGDLAFTSLDNHSLSPSPAQGRSCPHSGRQAPSHIPNALAGIDREDEDETLWGCCDCDLDDKDEAMLMEALGAFESRSKSAILGLVSRIDHLSEGRARGGGRVQVQQLQALLQGCSQHICYMERQNLEIGQQNDSMRMPPPLLFTTARQDCFLPVAATTATQYWHEHSHSPPLDDPPPHSPLPPTPTSL